MDARTLVAELNDILGRLQAARDAEDWDALPALDEEARALIQRATAPDGDEGSPLAASDPGVRRALEALSEFYASTVPSLAERRSETAREIKGLRQGQQAVGAYQTTRRG